MIQLFIDNKEVVLSDSFSTDFILSNPFFTKSGNYTLDIGINLRIPQNAAIYGFLQRRGVHSRPQNRVARLVDRARVITEGTEIILSLQDDTVNIQIVGDNSRLNYLTSQRDNIRDIRMSLNEAHISGWEDAFQKGYPEMDYCYASLLKLGHTRNNRQDLMLLNEGPRVLSYGRYPVPYLLYILRMVIQDAGYTIGENVIENSSDDCRIFVAPETGLQADTSRGNDVLFNKMLPAWSANDFLTEIEQFFNVVFLARPFSRVVDIVRARDFYADDVAVYYINAEDILEGIDKKYDIEDNLWINYDNIHYALPSSIYYKYADIPQDIVDRCDEIRFSDEIPEDSTVGSYNIYWNAMANYRCLRRPLKKDDQNDNEITALQMVCQFQGTVDVDSRNSTVLKVVPAEIVAFRMNTFLGDLIGYATVPLLDDIDYAEFNSTEWTAEAAEQISVNTEIEGRVEEEQAPGIIRVAYFNGMTPIHNNIPGAPANQSRVSQTAAQSQVTNAVIYSRRQDKENEQVFVCDSTARDLSIDYRYSHFYAGTVNVDTSVEYTVRFRNRGIIYDSKNIFVLGNTMFYCKEIKYKLLADGMSEVCEGIFYAFA